MIEVVTWDLELEVRAAGDTKTIGGVVVPWEQPANVVINRQSAYEVMRRGALNQSINQRGDRIPLTWYHPDPDKPYGDRKIIGVSKLDAWQDTKDGQRAGFTMLRTQQALEALEAIDARVVAAFSVAFKPVQNRTEVLKAKDGTPIYVRSEINLEHIALVPTGAYVGAGVDEVRALFEGSFVARSSKRALARARY